MFHKIVTSIALLFLITGPALAADTPQAMTLTDQTMYSKYSYRGEPDLRLTLAFVIAGGGPAHFSTMTLLHTLAGEHTAGEAARLEGLYGHARVTSFVYTMNRAMQDTLTLVKLNKIALPATPSIDPANGRLLSLAVYNAGVATDGRFDPGYMLEHLLSHPMHVALMHDLDMDPTVGRKRNQDLHIIITTLMKDLSQLY
jgi:hypothetical protein